MRRILKGMLFAIKKIQEILDVMSETAEGDEIYAELTQTRQQLIQAFTSETSGLQTQQAIEYREDCIGMLNFDATCLAKKFKMPEEVDPAAPVLGTSQAAMATPAVGQQPGRGGAILGGQRGGGVVLGQGGAQGTPGQRGFFRQV